MPSDHWLPSSHAVLAPGCAADFDVLSSHADALFPAASSHAADWIVLRCAEKGELWLVQTAKGIDATQTRFELVLLLRLLPWLA